MKMEPNPWQTRATFTEQQLRELIADLAKHGRGKAIRVSCSGLLKLARLALKQVSA